MKGNLLEALPLFVGAVLGVWLYHSTLDPVACLLVTGVLALLGWLARSSARALIRTSPVRAVRLWQIEVLLPVALLAAGGYGLTWLIESLPDLVQKLPLIDLPPVPDTTTAKMPDPTGAATTSADTARADRIAAISAALGTAVTAFVGALFLDEQKDSTGGYWPPAQIRQALVASFEADVNAMKAVFNKAPDETPEEFTARLLARKDEIEAYNRASRALYSEVLSDTEPDGWSLSGALARARIIEQHLLTRRSGP